MAEVLQLRQEFEALCEEAESRVEALQNRLEDVEMPPNTPECTLTVNLIHPRVIGSNSQNTRSQLILVWSFQQATFLVREQGNTGGTSLLDKTDDWAFIELVAAIPRLLPKIEASVMTNLPEKKLILAQARAALDACVTTDSEENEPAIPSRFQQIG
ncbi:MAG: hypothetical protein ACTS5I_17355 [Rhodanobacter sp.]